MLDISLFNNPRFSAASGAISLTFFGMFGAFFLLTQLLQSVMGYTALEAGVRLLPMAATQMVAAPLSAKVAERIGSKIVVAVGLLVASIGLLMASQLTADSSYGQVAIVLVVMAAGFASMMPSATEAIMGSLPPAKAGVGSAVNDTTRELGGAFGIAVLGSVVSSTYGPQVRDAVAGTPLPADLQTTASDQIGAAMAIAQRLGGAPGRALADAASSAFIDGMSTALMIGAAALALGAVVTALWLPARAAEPVGAATDDAGPVDGNGNPVDADTDGDVEGPADRDIDGDDGPARELAPTTA
jgi:Na+/melibiose symporter-like transporter